MATFVTHGMVGAAGTAVVCWHHGILPDHAVPVAVAGWIAGSLPDTADWIAAKVFGRERWVLYERIHSGDLVWLGFLVPPVLWHQLLDIPFHQRPGERWWPRLWPLEVGAFIVSAAVLFLVLKGEGVFP